MFEVGELVVNFNHTLARVVGFADSSLTADPILQAVGTDGRLQPGKWRADPAKVRTVHTTTEVVAVLEAAGFPKPNARVVAANIAVR